MSEEDRHEFLRLVRDTATEAAGVTKSEFMSRPVFPEAGELWRTWYVAACIQIEASIQIAELLGDTVWTLPHLKNSLFLLKRKYNELLVLENPKDANPGR